LLCFYTERFDEALTRIRANGAHVLDGPLVNPNARHREIRLGYPDGYVVVVAGAVGELGPA
jgi:hypothetical protein